MSNGARKAGAVDRVRGTSWSPLALPTAPSCSSTMRSEAKMGATPRLFDARRDERDACGIGFVADLASRPSREIVDHALVGLQRLRHRGAIAADARTGDGGGLLLPLDRDWLALPGEDPARLGVAMAFLPQAEGPAGAARATVEDALAAEGLTLLRWRPVPVEPGALGEHARATAPRIEQAVFLAPAGAS